MRCSTCPRPRRGSPARTRGSPSGPIQYAAPPPSLLALAPLAVLPLEVGVAIMLGLSVGGIVLTVRMLHLPWWWLLFPPFLDSAWNANPQSLLIPLILLGAGPVAIFLKAYAVIPIALTLRWRALLVTAGALVVTAPFLPWATYLERYGELSAVLVDQSDGGLSATAHAVAAADRPGRAGPRRPREGRMAGRARRLAGHAVVLRDACRPALTGSAARGGDHGRPGPGCAGRRRGRRRLAGPTLLGRPPPRCVGAGRYTRPAMTHVFVAPHPDDVALSCGGLIASLRELGQNVTIVTVFSGNGDVRGPVDLPARGPRLRQQDDVAGDRGVQPLGHRWPTTRTTAPPGPRPRRASRRRRPTRTPRPSGSGSARRGIDAPASATSRSPASRSSTTCRPRAPS